MLFDAENLNHLLSKWITITDIQNLGFITSMFCAFTFTCVLVQKNVFVTTKYPGTMQI